MAKMVKLPPVFTHPEWTLSNKMRYKNAEVERQFAEKIEAEADRLVGTTAERTDKTLADVDKKLEQRIDDLKYWDDELKNKSAEVSNELEALQGYRTRLARALEGYDDTLHLNNQCLLNRSKRRGLELVDDDPQKELRKESEIINGVIAIVKRSLEQVDEQIRLNRKALFNLNRDQRDKVTAEIIDSASRELNTINPEIGLYPGTATIEPNSVTPEQWMEITRENIQAAERQRINAINLRSLVDSTLQQVADDVRKQVENVDVALDRRIRELRLAKNKLTDHHAKVVEEEKKMEETIQKLEKAIEEKRAPLCLAETRLATRKQRPNIELCRDPAQYRLVEEVDEIQKCVSTLMEQLEAAKASLRGLTRQRLQVEDDIALKDHALFIDDVQCASLRKSIKVERF